MELWEPGDLKKAKRIGSAMKMLWTVFRLGSITQSTQDELNQSDLSACSQFELCLVREFEHAERWNVARPLTATLTERNAYEVGQ